MDPRLTHIVEFLMNPPTISITLPRCTWCGQTFDECHSLVDFFGTCICEDCAELITMPPKTVIHLVRKENLRTDPSEVQL